MSAGPTVLQDRYEVKQALGKGAYAQVYRATDRVSSQDVAIKVIHRSPKNFARDAEVQNLQTVHSQPDLQRAAQRSAAALGRTATASHRFANVPSVGPWRRRPIPASYQRSNQRIQS